MKRNKRVFVILAAICLVSAACFIGTAQAATALFSAPDTQIDVAVNEQFIIQLDSNVTTGYSWYVTDISNSAVVTKLAEEYVPPAGSALGAPGVQKFTFKALAAGKSHITFQYKRGEAGTAAETKTFTVKVKKNH